MSSRWLLVLTFSAGWIFAAGSSFSDETNLAKDAAEEDVAAVVEDAGEEDHALNREGARHIQVLRHPYDLAQFYRLGGSMTPTTYYGECCSCSESVASNPYAISNFYRSQASTPRYEPWFNAAPRIRPAITRSRTVGRQRGGHRSSSPSKDSVPLEER